MWISGKVLTKVGIDWLQITIFKIWTGEKSGSPFKLYYLTKIYIFVIEER